MISAGDSASFIIAQLVAFGDQMTGFSTEAEKATHVIDAVNEVANNFSVSSADLANNLGNMSAVMSQTGASFEESLSMLTAITEVTRNASKASRGLVSIGSRLNQIVDESSSTGKALKEIYEELGITLFDQEGQLRSSYDIFTDLAAIWNTLDKNTQNYIASQQAGTNQFQNFAALMSNFATATEATTIALNSAGSAAQENSRYMEGLEAKTSQLRATFEALSNTVLDSSLVAGILDLANAFLSLLNTPVGAFVTQVALLTGALGGFYALMQAGGWISKIGGQFVTAFGLFTGSVQSATVATTALGVASKVAFPLLGLIATAIAAIIAIAPKVSNWYKEITNDVEYANEKLEENNTQLKTNKERLEELQNVPVTSRTDEMQEEIDKLEEENRALQENIDKWEQKVKIGTYQDLTEGYSAVRRQQVMTVVTPESFIGTGIFAESEEEAIRLLKEMGEVAKDSTQSLSELGFVLGDMMISLPKEQYYAELIQNQKDITSAFLETGRVTPTLIQEYKQNAAALQELTLASEEISESELDDWVKTIIADFSEIPDITDQMIDSYYNVDQSIQQLTEGLTINQEQFEQLIETIPGYADVLQQVTDGYQLQEEALYELASAGNEWAREAVKQQLAVARGEVEAAARIVEAISRQIQAKQAYLQMVSAETGLTQMLPEEQTNLLLQQQNALAEMEEARLKVANLLAQIESWDKPPTTITGDGEDEEDAVDYIKAQSDAFKEQIAILEHELFLMEKNGATNEDRIQKLKEIQDVLEQQGKWFREQGIDDSSEYIRNLQEQWWGFQDQITSIYDSIAEEAEKAAEEARQAWEDSLNEQVDALQKMADDYETAFSYVAKKAQDEIDLLEQEKDAIQQRYDDQIAALEKTNEELDRQIELEEALDDLARARQTQVMVYKDGRFQYVSDVDQVSEAQANLDNLKREEQLRKEIENLEESRDAEIAAIDDKIDYWQKMVDEWSSAVDDYVDEQDRLIAEQILGADLEGENWEKRLLDLQEYVNRYKDILNQLNVAQQAANIISTGEDWKTSGNKVAIATGAGMSAADQAAIEQLRQQWEVANAKGDKTTMAALHAQAEAIRAKYGYSGGSWGNQYIPLYASGTTSATGGLSLVGEKGPELRVLGQGDGILPSDITKNLWAWGVTTPASMMSNIVGGLQSMGQQVGISIQNFAPSLPNVTDGQGFANYMRNNFWREALQFAKT